MVGHLDSTLKAPASVPNSGKTVLGAVSQEISHRTSYRPELMGIYGNLFILKKKLAEFTHTLYPFPKVNILYNNNAITKLEGNPFVPSSSL